VPAPMDTSMHTGYQTQLKKVRLRLDPKSPKESDKDMQSTLEIFATRPHKSP